MPISVLPQNTCSPFWKFNVESSEWLNPRSDGSISARLILAASQNWHRRHTNEKKFLFLFDRPLDPVCLAACLFRANNAVPLLRYQQDYGKCLCLRNRSRVKFRFETWNDRIRLSGYCWKGFNADLFRTVVCLYL